MTASLRCHAAWPNGLRPASQRRHKRAGRVARAARLWAVVPGSARLLAGRVPARVLTSRPVGGQVLRVPRWLGGRARRSSSSCTAASTPGAASATSSRACSGMASRSASATTAPARGSRCSSGARQAPAARGRRHGAGGDAVEGRSAGGIAGREIKDHVARAIARIVNTHCPANARRALLPLRCHHYPQRPSRPSSRPDDAPTVLRGGHPERAVRGPRSSSDRPLQITPIDGLRHIVERAALQELPRFVFFVIAADDDDCRWLRASSQVIENGMAVDAWHPNVEQHDVRREHLSLERIPDEARSNSCSCWPRTPAPRHVGRAVEVDVKTQRAPRNPRRSCAAWRYGGGR